MGWIKTLADTYDACQDLVGVADRRPSSLIRMGKRSENCDPSRRFITV